MSSTIGDLKPDKKNARKHNPRNIGMIEKSLQEVGAARSIVIDEDNNILAGNGTVEAAGNAGIEKMTVVETDGNEIVAVRRRGLTNEQKKKLALYDNRTAEIADWDVDILKGLSEEIDLSGMFSEKELVDIGFDEKEIVEDEIPEIPKVAKTVKGDLYELGRHRLMCGDSTNSDDVARLMDGKKADMVFTDPPYGIDFIRGGIYSRKRKEDTIIADKGQDFSKTLSAALPLIFSSCQSKQVFICCDWRSYSDFEKALKEINKEATNLIVWDKETTPYNVWRYTFVHEFILYFGNNKADGGNFRGKNVWRIQRQTEKEHPTAKPVALVERAIKDSSESGEMIVDLFLGSGSTLIAAEQTNRICYGMEIEPKYCDVIVSRYVKFTDNNKVKLNGKEIIWEV